MYIWYINISWLDHGTLQPEQQHYSNMHWRFRVFKLGLRPFLLHKEAEALEPTDLHHLLQRVGCCHDYSGTFSWWRSSESDTFGNGNQYCRFNRYYIIQCNAECLSFGILCPCLYLSWIQILAIVLGFWPFCISQMTWCTRLQLRSLDNLGRT